MLAWQARKIHSGLGAAEDAVSPSVDLPRQALQIFSDSQLSGGSGKYTLSFQFSRNTSKFKAIFFNSTVNYSLKTL